MDEAVWRGLHPVVVRRDAESGLPGRQVPAAQILELEQLKQMVYLLKGQILYAAHRFQEAETVGKRMDGALGTLFLKRQPVWSRSRIEWSHFP